MSQDPSPAFKAPGVCIYLNLIGIVCGLTVAVWAFAGAIVFLGASLAVAQIQAPGSAAVAASVIAVIAFLLGAAPMIGFSRLIEYVAKIEWHLARARAAAVPIPAASRVYPAPSYFYGDNGQEIGPFEVEWMRSMAQKGMLRSDTPVYRRGDGEWKTLADFPELA